MSLRKIDCLTAWLISNYFSWTKMIEYRFKFHWNLLPGVQVAIIQHWSGYWLVAEQATIHPLLKTSDDPVHRRIYATLGGDELTRLVQTLKLSYRNWSVTLLHVSLRYQQPWYWFGRIYGCLCSARKHLKYMHHLKALSGKSRYI